MPNFLYDSLNAPPGHRSSGSTFHKAIARSQAGFAGTALADDTRPVRTHGGSRMSQHLFRTTHQHRPVLITMGWDRPLQYVFLTVKRLDPAEDSRESDYLYTNLDDETTEPSSLEYYCAQLTRLGLEIPPSMRHAVADDEAQNVGNKQVEYHADGSCRVLYGETD